MYLASFCTLAVGSDFQMSQSSEYDTYFDVFRLCSETSGKQALTKSHSEGIRVTPRSPMKKDLISHPAIQSRNSKLLLDFHFQSIRSYIEHWLGMESERKGAYSMKKF